MGFLLDTYRDGFLHELVSTHQVSTLVFIVVNARNRVPDPMDATPRAPGVSSVVVSAMGASTDRHTGTLARALEELRDAQGSSSAVKMHVIEVNLEDLPDEPRRERLLALGTNYGLSADDVRDVADAGSELLARSRGLAELVAELDGTISPR